MNTLSNLSVLILAGGKATRMGGICADVPKPMIDFDGKPFLEWLAEWYLHMGVHKIVVAGGNQNAHYYQAIFDVPTWYDRGLRLICEPGQLGTGGAIKYCLAEYQNFSSDLLICNGDTVLDYDIRSIYEKWISHGANITALHTLDGNAPNKGSVKVSDGRVVSFSETGDNHYVLAQDELNYLASSTGHYMGKTDRFDELFPEGESSLEAEVIPSIIKNHSLNGLLAGDKFFFDYGTPKRYDWLKRNEGVVSSIYRPQT